MARLGRYCCAIFALLCAPAFASPWAEVGDAQLRSDIEILASAGVIADITSHWPLPWTAIAQDIQSAALANQPAFVRAAAARVLQQATHQTTDGTHTSASLDLTNRPNLVYGFDGLGRGDGQSETSFGYSSESISARLSLGLFSPGLNGHGTRLVGDDSYVAAKIGDAMVYAGYVTHWWGPGWISALSLSNNALPMPQIGIERLDNSASDWPVLGWLGPWQAEFFVGLLYGPRIDSNTLYNALRVTFNPAPGLQIGLARTQEFCGQHHVCDPLRGYFDLSNTAANLDITNDEGLIDVQYTTQMDGFPVEAYLQLMNEDSNPIIHSGTTHLFGFSLWRPIADDLVRFTAEYTDSVATDDIFSFGAVNHGFSYTNFTYLDGMHYRGRTLGFSLDTDSRLLTLQAAWNDDAGRSYELSLHHAAVSNPNNLSGNVVTTAPVIVNLAEARLTIPVPGVKLDLAARLQDDQPRPRKGFAASLEAKVRYEL